MELTWAAASIDIAWACATVGISGAAAYSIKHLAEAAATYFIVRAETSNIEDVANAVAEKLFDTSEQTEADVA